MTIPSNVRSTRAWDDPEHPLGQLGENRRRQEGARMPPRDATRRREMLFAESLVLGTKTFVIL